MPKISQLTAGTTPAGTELLAAVQSGATVSLTALQIAKSILGSAPSSTDNAVVRFDGVSGSMQNSLVTINDAGGIVAANITLSGSITQARTTTHFDTNKINRFNNRSLFGAATDNDGTAAGTDLDWLSALSNISVGGGDGVGYGGGSDVPYATVAILTDRNSDLAASAPLVGLLVGAESRDNNAGGGPRALEVFGINNPDDGTHPTVWGHYTETHDIHADAGNTFAFETQVRNSAAARVGTPYSLPTYGTYGHLYGAGAGLSATGQYNATAAILIASNPMLFSSGIIFEPGSVAADAPGGTKGAIQLPYDHQIQWFTSGGGLVASAYADISGNLHLDADGAISFSSNTQLPNGSVYGWGDFSTYIGGDASTDVITFAAGGAAEMYLTTAALSPATSDGLALGTTSLMFSDAFFAAGAVVNFNNGDVTITHATNQLLFAGASSGYTFDAVTAPATNDGAALGNTSNAWSDLFLASGGVINWNNGDVTASHVANTLLFAGASNGYTFDAIVAPTTNDGAPLGNATNSWSDVFVASGGVINFANANYTLTHSSGALTAAGGPFTAPSFIPSGSTVPSNGLYLPASNTLGWAINSAAEMQLTAAALSPAASDGLALGTTALPWADLHLATGGVVNWANGGITITESSDSLLFEGAASGFRFSHVVVPTANDGAALGDTNLKWSDLFLASGAVINFNSGNYTLTHSAGALAAAGGPFTAPSFIPSSSTVPTNGLYLAAANTLALSTNSAVRVTLTSGALTCATGVGIESGGNLAVPDGSVFIFGGVSGTAYMGGSSASGFVNYVTGGTERGRFTLGLTVGAPTGGDKGAGTINATAVYDDNTLLTCYPFEALANGGKIDISRWDAMVPDRIHRDHVTGEIIRTEQRQHDPLRKFMARLGTEHDPMKLESYVAHWREKRHLTSLPNEEKYDAEDGGLSTGEWLQRLVETVELQAIHDAELLARVAALESQH